jgi:hypothetical protein
MRCELEARSTEPTRAISAPMLDLDNKPLPPRRPRRAAGWLARVAVDNAGGAVYGTVMVGVLLAAEDTHREGYPETIGAATVVLALYWLMSLYTHTLGIRLRTRGRLSLRLLGRSCAYELAMVEGAFVPVLALLIAWAAGATVTSGVTVALWATVASLITLEAAAAWRAHLRPQEVWLQAALGAVMGLAIIALKLILH